MEQAVADEWRSGLGNVLVAKRSFKPGDVVVYEQPLLQVPQLKPSNPLYRPLQTYFEQHGIPSSVVLKLLAYCSATSADQARVLACRSPDPAAFADAQLVQQAQRFAGLLLQHPPVPDFRELLEGACRHQQQQQQQQQQLSAHELLVKLALVWATNGHSFGAGSALFRYGSTLTHTCAAPNTAFRTASGDTAPVHGQAAGDSSNAQQPLGAPRPAPAAAAGYHAALADVQPGEPLTTNYLGLGHRRLMSTPARQQLLRRKFLFKCTCDRCTLQRDLARGIPCPACSGPFRADDKLLSEDAALPSWPALPLPPDTGEAAGDIGPSSSSSEQQQCGYVYCDMQQLLAGAAQPWRCDQCGAGFADDLQELWGRYYARSYATIEGDMESWVVRLDESVDDTPLVRVPSKLHERVVGVVRLLGPRHWAAWRLLLLGTEMHCGVLEQAMLQHKVSPSTAPVVAASPAATASSAPPTHQQQQEQQPSRQSAAQGTAAAASSWVVRYCRCLWDNISTCYGEIEAGQLLGYHFAEASQVLLQVASCPGLLPAAAAEALMDAALQLQQQVLPGMRSLLGPDYSPMQKLLGQGQQQDFGSVLAAAGVQSSSGPAAAAGAAAGQGGRPGRYVPASVRRHLQQQAAEEARVQALVAELKQLECEEEEQQQ
ncbi:hypothetical protein COO60DRAFT_305903 [Scenedesmus sp. NREL 46B-D3]|nr:hypothetical protein COO60DRAFT_305903 [Scenedesmus sp. NREL 46B-D3]